MAIFSRRKRQRDPHRSGMFAWSDPFAHARLGQGDLEEASEVPDPPANLRGALRQTQVLMAQSTEDETIGTEVAFKSFWEGEDAPQSVEERFKKILK